MKDILPTLEHLGERAEKSTTPEFPDWLALYFHPLTCGSDSARAEAVMALHELAKNLNESGKWFEDDAKLGNYLNRLLSLNEDCLNDDQRRIIMDNPVFQTVAERLAEERAPKIAAKAAAEGRAEGRAEAEASFAKKFEDFAIYLIGDGQNNNYIIEKTGLPNERIDELRIIMDNPVFQTVVERLAEKRAAKAAAEGRAEAEASFAKKFEKFAIYLIGDGQNNNFIIEKTGLPNERIDELRRQVKTSLTF
jgi:hypothetical protein